MDILVIDDNPSHLKLAHLVLSAAGHHVNDATAAGQALDLVRVEKPDIILLDLELPGMDGLALVKQFKADPETADIHVIAVTSYPERYPRSAMMEAGCAAYINKPINTRTLPGQMEELLK